MANTYKNIVIAPNSGSNSADPTIVFSGANTTVNTDIYLRVYPDSNGTLSFEGSAGQLFSITNDLTGSIFSVNDISGIPLVDVNVTSQQVSLAPTYANVGVGTSNAQYKLDVNGTVNVSSSLVAWGNVGIGISNAISKLHVYGNSPSFVVQSNYSNDGSIKIRNVTHTDILTISTDTGAGSALTSFGPHTISVSPTGGGSYVLKTNNVNRMTIDTFGNVAIGPGVASYKLDVTGTVNASSILINQVPIYGWTQVTGNVTATPGQWLMCDTTNNAISITLPATPNTNVPIKINSGPVATTNNITVVRNGSTIMSLSEDMIISENNITVDLVYSGSTWRIA